MGSCKRDYDRFPPQLQRYLGFELFLAQTGQAVDTVRFREAVYVLHAFMKKSKHGIKTPKHDIELIRRRLKAAEADYAKRTDEKKP